MEMTVNTDIQAVVLGFQSALAAIEGELKNKELANRLRGVFNDTINALLPTKYFAYAEGSDSVSIFNDEETRDNYIDCVRNDFEGGLHNDDEELNLKPISFEEFTELFNNGNNPDLYTANEEFGELVYTVF